MPCPGGTAWLACIIAGSNLLSTAVKFPAARSATAWAAWEANGPGDVGEVPAPLLQAARKHATANDPSAAAQRAGGRYCSADWPLGE